MANNHNMPNYAVYHNGELRQYVNGNNGLEGWDIIGDVNQFIDCSEYEDRYKHNYPQVDTVLVFKQRVISAVSALPDDYALPVGVLFGKEISPLRGEKKGYYAPVMWRKNIFPEVMASMTTRKRSINRSALPD
jgi:hypothetical protein